MPKGSWEEVDLDELAKTGKVKLVSAADLIGKKFEHGHKLFVVDDVDYLFPNTMVQCRELGIPNAPQRYFKADYVRAHLLAAPEKDGEK